MARPSHEHSEVTLGTASTPEEVKAYYQDIETYDWADVTDHFVGLETFFHRHRFAIVRKLIARYAEAPVLDAGCGTGMNLRHLPAGSTGIDINPRNLAVIKVRVPEAIPVLGDLDKMPFSDASFTTVLCTEVLEHVPNAKSALGEIARVLRPGGKLLGTVPADSVLWRLRFLSHTCPGGEPFHNEYSKEEICSMLESVGLEPIDVHYSFPRFHVVFIARKP